MITIMSKRSDYMGRKMEVVIVDDESMITDLIKSYVQFASENTEIHCFNDSVKAQEFLRNKDIDILITDYKMPGVSGMELLREAGSDTRKIMISGYISEIAEEKLNSINALCLEKPVSMKDLSGVIREKEKQLI